MIYISNVIITPYKQIDQSIKMLINYSLNNSIRIKKLLIKKLN